jgi:hypothetical protein
MGRPEMHAYERDFHVILQASGGGGPPDPANIAELPEYCATLDCSDSFYSHGETRHRAPASPLLTVAGAREGAGATASAGRGEGAGATVRAGSRGDCTGALSLQQCPRI